MNVILDIVEYLIILVLVLAVVWMVWEKLYINKNDDVIEWINVGHPSGKYGDFNPASRLKDIIARYGEPDVIDKSKGGFAIWKKNTLEKRGFCWDRVEIRDEQIPHEKPGPHVDFLYTWYKIYIPDNLVNDVRSLSESITYDPLKKMLRVRCHAISPNIATLVLAKRVANNEMTIDEAKRSYGPFIFSTIKGHQMYNPDAEKSMYEELCDNKKTQKWTL